MEDIICEVVHCVIDACPVEQANCSRYHWRMVASEGVASEGVLVTTDSEDGTSLFTTVS
jgi:hypothetical protein